MNASARRLPLVVTFHPAAALFFGRPSAASLGHDVGMNAGRSLARMHIDSCESRRFRLKDCRHSNRERPQISAPRAPMVPIGHCCSPQTSRSRPPRSSISYNITIKNSKDTTSGLARWRAHAARLKEDANRCAAHADAARRLHVRRLFAGTRRKMKIFAAFEFIFFFFPRAPR
jgi:hypothetical protein